MRMEAARVHFIEISNKEWQMADINKKASPGVLMVTGAGRGIGAAVAKLAAVCGYRLVVNFAQDAQSAAEVVRHIAASGGTATAIQADISREQEVLGLFEAAERELGPLTGLVNNAGVTGGFARVEAVTSAVLTQVFAVNVIGAMLCAREAVRRMSTRNGGAGGAIVNISSRAAQIGGAGEWVHYAASKGALDTFTLGLAREVAVEGIRVNAVAPGHVLTDLHATSGDPDRPTRLAPTIPMGRAGAPEEIAEAVLWLLSPAASYTTGAILAVSGGR
jgi:NAD(P)-dependent dehydrogenase (short-subunit alcohol dehydrogenase family)